MKTNFSAAEVATPSPHSAEADRVSIKATHYCVKSHGVMDANSRTQTTALGGIFKTRHKTRAEFLA